MQHIVNKNSKFEKCGVTSYVLYEVYLSNEHSTSSEGSKMAESHKSLVNRLSMVPTKALRSFGGDIRSYSAGEEREIEK